MIEVWEENTQSIEQEGKLDSNRKSPEKWGKMGEENSRRTEMRTKEIFYNQGVLKAAKYCQEKKQNAE